MYLDVQDGIKINAGCYIYKFVLPSQSFSGGIKVTIPNLNSFAIDNHKVIRHICTVFLVNSLTTKKQTTKFSSGNFKKHVKSKLYKIENSKSRGRTV